MCEDTPKSKGNTESNKRIRNYDDEFRDCIRRPDVLSNLLGEWIEELKGKTPEEIIQCLDIGNGRVRSLDTKLVIGDTYIVLDNLIRIKLPDSKEVDLYLDIEGQNNPSPGYDLSNRMTTYICRMILEQTACDEVMDHDRLKKCYAVLIVLQPSKKDSNRVDRYSMMREDDDNSDRGTNNRRYDKMKIIEVYIPEHDDKTPEGNMEILKLLFNRLPDPKQNSDNLAKLYNIHVNESQIDRMGRLQEECEYTVLARNDAKHIDALVRNTGCSFEEAISILEIPENDIGLIKYILDDMHYEG